jgi:hypothetical protein
VCQNKLHGLEVFSSSCRQLGSFVEIITSGR